MEPTWKTKTGPVKHPVRYAAKVWQLRMKERFGIAVPEFTPQEYGQLKQLVKHLGTLTPDVIDWALDEVNWWHFCQRARHLHKLKFVPDRPEVGFLLQFRGHALHLINSMAESEVA
jgi:hypothetical protein